MENNGMSTYNMGERFTAPSVCVYLCVGEHLRAGFRATLDACGYRGALLHFLVCCGRSNLKELWIKNDQPKKWELPSHTESFTQQIND